MYDNMKSNHETEVILLGKRIRSLRNEKGWTQQELGDQAEVNYKFIGEIERGQQNPSFNILVKIAAALGVDLLDLFRYAHEISDRRQIEKKITAILSTIDDQELKRVLLILHSLYPTH